MTHDTREVEDIVDELYSLAWQDGSEGLNRRSALNERFQSAIHHQLQKAREEESDRIVAIINDIDAPEGAWREALTGFKKVLVSAINHSELDQDKALQDNK